jgi:hypothetical protein
MHPRRTVESLTKLERRYLSRRFCMLCEARLDRDSCSSIYGKCKKENRDERRANCLAEYKPRKFVGT